MRRRLKRLDRLIAQAEARLPMAGDGETRAAAEAELDRLRAERAATSDIAERIAEGRRLARENRTGKRGRPKGVKADRPTPPR